MKEMILGWSEMGGACGTDEGKEMHTKFLWGNTWAWEYLESLGIDMSIILCILKKWNGMTYLSGWI
jgi:hypothetical protein